MILRALPASLEWLRQLTAPVPPVEVPRPILAAPDGTDDARLPSRVLVGLALFLVAFAPRWWICGRYDVMCNDGPHYVVPAMAVVQGQYHLLRRGDFNVFPITGVLLARLGLDVELGLKYWNLLCASVLAPVAYWLFLRLLNERLGVLSALLLAVHPKLIEWSCEVVRDTSFVLFVAMASYALWRAVVHLRLQWFFWSGLAASLAIQTRFEGWLLTMIAAVWWAGRFWLLRAHRPRLAAGLAVMLLPFPLLVMGMNLAMYGASVGRYEVGANLDKLEHLTRWLHRETALPPATAAAEQPNPPLRPAVVNHAPALAISQAESPQGTPLLAAGQSSATAPQGSPREAAAAAPQSDAASDSLPPQPTNWDRLWALAHVLERGCTPAFGITLLLGMWWWRGIIVRWELLPLSLFSLLTVGGIWVHLRSDSGTSTRYCLTIVLFAAPTAAVGALELAHRLAVLLARIMSTSQQTLHLPSAAAVLLSVCAIGAIDGLVSADEGRAHKAEIGRFVRASFGKNRRMLITYRGSLAAYYAGAYRPVMALAQHQGDALLAHIAREQPEVVVIWRAEVTPATWELLMRELPCVREFTWHNPARHGPIQAAVFRGPGLAGPLARAPATTAK